MVTIRHHTQYQSKFLSVGTGQFEDDRVDFLQLRTHKILACVNNTAQNGKC